MGLPEAKAALATLKTEVLGIVNLFDRYNLLFNLRKYADNKLQDTASEIKALPPPTNISELKNYIVVDDLGNKYSVDKDGKLTKI
jgi:hypothetical protein